jgi:hypothetical protein
MENIDLHHVAHFLIGRHGKTARYRAVVFANAHYDQGDDKGGDLWLGVSRLIEHLSGERSFFRRK